MNTQINTPVKLEQRKMYNFPWSKTDNPGAWIEVTDICNMSCPGCFRKNNFEGHRPLDEIKKEILQCIEMTNCSRLSISGGEPLLYPDIIEVVKFISSHGLKPIILTNGILLTSEFAEELKKAGLFQYFLHVDNGQNRPGWINKTEAEMNHLRQYYVDMVKKTGKVQCGFNMTIRRSNLHEVTDVVKWYRSNIDRCTHLSFIAFRGIPKDIEDFMCLNDNKLERDGLPEAARSTEDISISAEDIFRELYPAFISIYPSAYLHGTLKSDSFKLITTNNIGSKREIFGSVGPKTMEFYQVFYHILHGKYDATTPGIGKLIFFMALFDKQVRQALGRFLIAVLKNPFRLFERFFIQSFVIQQPFEVIDGGLNLCDGCINLMPYKGEMINSCRLDEYRLLGGPVNYSYVYRDIAKINSTI